jgi:hypothetical protein
MQHGPIEAVHLGPETGVAGHRALLIEGGLIGEVESYSLRFQRTDPEVSALDEPEE